MTDPNDALLLGKSSAGQPATLLLKYANRHGLIAGATGTGKTLTLQGLAEGFSTAGVPVFIADIKGDLAGLAMAGGGNPRVEERAREIGVPLEYRAFPAVFWDIFGERGHPVRTTISEMGPLLLGQLLELSEVQAGVLNVVFAAADKDGMLLLDLDDLRAMLAHVGENAGDYSAQFGHVAPASVNAIQRALLAFEQQGARHFFGEPAVQVNDFLRIAPNGEGAVNILAADKLMGAPRLYATFMLWLLSELFETLPEVGDQPKPKLVFFFDEAHLLFDAAPKPLLAKIEQLVRLIRSKGVGVYFITQNPADLPDDVLGQLSNRVQHALRAFTPQDRKGVRAAAETFRANPAFDTEEAIGQLAVGEALVSTLDARGTPTPVDRILIRPPFSHIGAIPDTARADAIAHSPYAGVYDTEVNRESAAEIIAARVESVTANPTATTPAKRGTASAGSIWGTVATSAASAAATSAGRAAASAVIRSTLGGSARGRKADSVATAAAKAAMRTASGTLGRQLVRGILGALHKS